jgi:proline iminopeptidase
VFPPVDAVDAETLVTADGHLVYYESFGNPDGVPIVFLHGGPGSGASVNQRRLLDPALFRAVIVDQRGTGRSRPLASDPGASRDTNTTQLLISDLEAIREHLGIERWVLAGFSWGTTLGLAYALAHRDRCRGLLLALVTTTSAREVRWITRDVGEIFPREYERFVAFIPDALRALPNVTAYAEMLWGSDVELAERAAVEWCRWEDAHVSLAPGHRPNPRYEDPEFRLRFARLVTHYWSHAAFVEEDALLLGSAELSGLPVILVHGRFDVSSPLSTAWRLHHAIDTSELHILDESGHGDGSDFMPTVLAALDRLGRS